MRNSHFRFGSINLILSRTILPLLLPFAAVVFSCDLNNRKHVSRVLYSSLDLKINSVTLNLPDWQREFVYYKMAETGELLVWTYPDHQLKILSLPDGKTLYSLNLDSLFDFKAADVSVLGDSIMISGWYSEFAFYDRSRNVENTLNIKDALCIEPGNSYAYKNFPIEIEGTELFQYTGYSLDDYMTNIQVQKKLFSGPLEIRYNLKNSKSKCFGSYPILYQNNEMDFYDWRPHRQRFNGNSVYSFPVIDSLYICNDKTGKQYAIECKSILDTRFYIPFDKSRYSDYKYIYEHLLSNGRNYGLVADPFRNLLYSIFISGNNPPEARRLKYSDVAFTVRVYNKDLDFVKEVYFPPGLYNPGRHFITPDGLAFQTASSDVSSIRVFDIFDFTRVSKPLENLPEKTTHHSPFVSLHSYLRDTLAIPINIDTVVVISGLGCTGCLESLLMDAEAKGENLDQYAWVVTNEASRTLTIQNFIQNRRHAWVEEVPELSYYRAIGDFLTLVVIREDTIVVDDKFSLE